MDGNLVLLPEHSPIQHVPIERRHINLGELNTIPMSNRDRRVEQSTYLEAYVEDCLRHSWLRGPTTWRHRLPSTGCSSEMSYSSSLNPFSCSSYCSSRHRSNSALSATAATALETFRRFPSKCCSLHCRHRRGSGFSLSSRSSGVVRHARRSNRLVTLSSWSSRSACSFSKSSSSSKSTTAMWYSF